MYKKDQVTCPKCGENRMVNVKVGDKLSVVPYRLGGSDWDSINGSTVTRIGINGKKVYYKKGDFEDWFDPCHLKEGDINVVAPKSKDAKHRKKVLEELRCIRCVLERLLRGIDESLFVDYQMEKFGKAFKGDTHENKNKNRR